MRNTQGGVRLRDWLRDERRTQKWLGEQIGVHQSTERTHQATVSKWILGQTPPLAATLAMKDITGIEPRDWLVPAEESATSLPDDSQLHARVAG